MTNGDYSAALAKAERALASARIAFNLDRGRLQTALDKFQAATHSHDALISTADEYGIDHALSDLAKSPASYGVQCASELLDLALLKPLLTRAYEGNHSVDRALGERERLRTLRDPSYVRVFQLGDDEVAFDEERGVLIYPLKGREAKADVTHVEPRDEHREPDWDYDQ